MSISFNQIPRDIQLLIFSYLKPEGLGRCSRVSKLWHAIANTESLWRALYPPIAFGKREWEQYLGDVGEEPFLPRVVYKILKSPCPFFPGKRVDILTYSLSSQKM